MLLGELNSTLEYVDFAFVMSVYLLELEIEIVVLVCLIWLGK